MPYSNHSSFHDYFDMVPVTHIELKQAAYRLRHQVYCQELGFEKAENFPDGMEKDEYDDFSQHYLIQHRKSGVYAATTRIILPTPGDLAKPFPTELHSNIDRGDLLAGVPRQQIAEVSRFCIRKMFRRRKGEEGQVSGVGSDLQLYLASSDKERRAYPHLTIALISCLLRMSEANGITHWYAIIEPGFIRLLQVLGIHFITIGPAVEYHGLRYPCVIKVANLLEGVKQKTPEIYEFLTA